MWYSLVFRVSVSLWEGGRVCLIFITEEDERAYYLKSQAQRKQKFLKRGRKVRGQDKVIRGLLHQSGVHLVANVTLQITTTDHGLYM